MNAIVLLGVTRDIDVAISSGPMVNPDFICFANSARSLCDVVPRSILWLPSMNIFHLIVAFPSIGSISSMLGVISILLCSGLMRVGRSIRCGGYMNLSKLFPYPFSVK